MRCGRGKRRVLPRRREAMPDWRRVSPAIPAFTVKLRKRFPTSPMKSAHTGILPSVI